MTRRLNLLEGRPSPVPNRPFQYRGNKQIEIDRRDSISPAEQGLKAKNRQKKNKAFLDQLKQHPEYRYKVYKKDAGKRGIAFNLTYEEFGQFWRLPCSYCNSEILNIGLDRVDNSKGYEIGNVVSCCTLCNRMKSTLPVDAFIEHCRKILEHYQSG